MVLHHSILMFNIGYEKFLTIAKKIKNTQEIKVYV